MILEYRKAGIEIDIIKVWFIVIAYNKNRRLFDYSLFKSK